MASLPSGTVTFLFTDIEGSTRLLQQLKDAYADVLAECRRLLRTAVQERGGQEVDTEGDAVFAAFPSAREALLAAVMAQQSILRHRWPDGAAVRVRMGLHTGEARVAEGGYVGMDVHRGARICAAAHGGQILVTDVTQGLVTRDLPEGVSLSDLGEHRLKDLAHPHRLFQVLASCLPADFPPLPIPRRTPSQLADPTQRGEARFRLLETVRQYARDQLLESEKPETTRDRHLGFFLSLAERAEPQLNNAEQVMWFNRLGSEHDNLRAALAWSMQSAPRNGLRLAGALGQFWMRRASLAEGRRWLEEALERGIGGSATLHAKALNWAGEIAIRQMDYAAARLLLEKGLAIYRELEDQKGIADSLSDLGVLSMYEADHTSACALFEQSLAIDRRLGNKSGIVYTLSSLGHETWAQGDLVSARRFLEEALLLAREWGQRWQEMRILWNLGLVAFDQHNFEEAHSRYKEGLLGSKVLGMCGSWPSWWRRLPL